ncbi:MAG: SBBP repeat-containing protein [Flavobacteriales bacterium]
MTRSSQRITLTALLLAIMHGSTLFAQVQWMHQGGIGGMGNGIASDQLGNAYVTGQVNAPALFDEDTVPSHFADAFIAKYDEAGNVQWVRTGGADLIDRANDIAVDTDGNAYITGFFSTNGPDPTVSFDGVTLTGLGSTDLFVAKYDAGGALLWVRSGGGPLGDQGRGITLTPDGNVVVSGFFQGTAVFDTDTHTSLGMGDIILLKYDPNGDLLWSADAGGPGDEQAGKPTALDNGDVAVVGQYQQTAFFGAASITSQGLSNIFLARFDASGDPLWAVTAGSSVAFAGDVAFDVDHAPNGDLVLCGEIAGDATFGGTAVPTNGSLDVFIARYNGEGNLLWVRHGGGPQQDHAYGVAVDADGNSYLTGQADDGATTVFDSITLAPFGNEAVFLAKYDATGAVQWVRRYAPGLGGAVAALDGGCVYFTGGASGIVGQPAFDTVPWQFVDRAIFTARFCEEVPTSISQVGSSDTFSVFPVPADDRLTVCSPSLMSGRTRLFLMDASARIVRTESVRGVTTSIDVAGLDPGCYQLVIEGTERRSSRTVLISR